MNADGSPGEAQDPRSGMETVVTYRASEPGALLTPRDVRTPGQLREFYEPVRFIREGQYTLGWDSTGIPAAPGQELQVTVRRNSTLASLTDFQLMAGLETGLPLVLAPGETLTLKSADASLIGLRPSPPANQPPAPFTDSVTVAQDGGGTKAVLFGALRAGGPVRVEVSGWMGGQQVEQSFLVYPFPYKPSLTLRLQWPLGAR